MLWLDIVIQITSISWLILHEYESYGKENNHKYITQFFSKNGVYIRMVLFMQFSCEKWSTCFDPFTTKTVS